MTCPSCSALNDAAASFCSSCGQRLKQAHALIAARPNEGSAQAQLQRKWSFWAIASAALLVLVALLFFLSSFNKSYNYMLPFFACIVTVISITCGQVALAETGYVQRNRTSFWIAVVSLFIGYFVIVGYLAVLINILRVFSNWR